MNTNYRNRIGLFNKAGVLFMSSFGRVILLLVVIGSLHGSALYTGLTQMEQFSVNSGRIAAATIAMGFVVFLYTSAMNSVVFARDAWLQFPDKLWKISVYRGLVRLGLFLVWNGLYFFALHVETGSNSLFRTWFMTGLGAWCVVAIFIEACSFVSDKSIITFGESWLPMKTVDGEPEPRGNGVRRALQPFVYRARRGLAAARGFSDFWYKEMDKFFGLIIFTILFFMSLLPVATMQTVLIWNEAFSDILAKRIGVQDTVSSILD
jgi:hypothetical protein